MSRSKHKMALDIPLPAASKLEPDMREYFGLCEQKLGFIPNVLACYSFDQTKLRAFVAFYNDLMLGDSALSRLEREMIAVVVSSANHCYYCLTAHGAAVRKLSDDPKLGEVLVMNYRAARLSARHRAMLDFAHEVTTQPAATGRQARAALRAAGFSDRAIWDIAAVAAFYNMTNRLAAAIEMVPNEEYHSQVRVPAKARKPAQRRTPRRGG